MDLYIWGFVTKSKLYDKKYDKGYIIYIFKNTSHLPSGGGDYGKYKKENGKTGEIIKGKSGKGGGKKEK